MARPRDSQIGIGSVAPTGLATVAALAILVGTTPLHAQALWSAPWPAEIGAAPLLTPTEDRARALDCLTSAIVHEAGIEPLAGQQAVAQVVMNRLRAPAYPKTVCGVIFQGVARRTGCQFSFACDGSMSRVVPVSVLDRARSVAIAALDAMLPDRVGDATHYHADYVSPGWASRLDRVGQIGAHIFYRGTPGGRAEPAQGGAARALLVARQDAPMTASAAASRPFSPWGLPLAAASPADR